MQYLPGKTSCHPGGWAKTFMTSNQNHRHVKKVIFALGQAFAMDVQDGMK